MIPDQPVVVTEPIAEVHDVNQLADAVGVDIPEEEPLNRKEKLDQRDEQRWQLDIDSTANH